jgi:hypothetical protein
MSIDDHEDDIRQMIISIVPSTTLVGSMISLDTLLEIVYGKSDRGFILL